VVTHTHGGEILVSKVPLLCLPSSLDDHFFVIIIYKHNIIFTTYKPLSSSSSSSSSSFSCQILFYNFVASIKISTFLFTEFLCSFFLFLGENRWEVSSSFWSFCCCCYCCCIWELQRTNFLHLQGLWNHICFGKSFVFWVCVFWWRCGFFLGDCDQIVECWKACVVVVVVVLLLLLCLMMIHDMFVVVS